MPTSEETSNSNRPAVRDQTPQARRYPELSQEQLTELARKLLRMLKEELAIERDRFGR